MSFLLMIDGRWGLVLCKAPTFYFLLLAPKQWQWPPCGGHLGSWVDAEKGENYFHIWNYFHIYEFEPGQKVRKVVEMFSLSCLHPYSPGNGPGLRFWSLLESAPHPTAETAPLFSRLDSQPPHFHCWPGAGQGRAFRSFYSSAEEFNGKMPSNQDWIRIG